MNISPILFTKNKFDIMVIIYHNITIQQCETKFLGISIF
jgi:hypothetical protein